MGGSGAHVPPSGLPPASREAALLRLARALEAAKWAKKHGFDVKEARALLRRGREAFVAGSYASAAWYADQVIRLFERFGPPPPPLC